jgi:protein-tyrosine phosphatase
MRSAARLLKRGVVDLYWTLRGPRIQVPGIPANPRSMLFVCKGNICRSPFAEHIALKMQGEGLVSGMKFGSAGLDVPKSISSPNDAIHGAKPYGIHLEKHRSQSISLDLVESYDMIIAMEAWQYAALQSSFQHHNEKLFLLPLMDPKESAKYRGYAAFNIQDPYGGPPSVFEECFDRVSMCLKSLFATVGSKPESV